MDDAPSAAEGPISDRLEALFDRLLDVPPEERPAVLDAVCADDADLRREVCELLEADARAEQVLPPPDSFETAGGAEDIVATGAGIGRRYGNCTVTALIAAGGMGLVFLAEQDRPRRRVAVKVIRGGAHTAAILRRFEVEAAVLGRLQHPGIARIYEVGVAREDDAGDAGDDALAQPYIVMEYVEGLTLLEHAEREALDAAARVDLLARICDAVAHAHHHGVVHRDLKPGNILVTPDGQPKVLDFGVARVTDEAGTVHTHTGQLLGTVQYMSPEQASGHPGETDAQTDVYALGMIGFELLAGRLPYEFRTPMVHDMVRVIQTEEPTRLGNVDTSFRGDLETIIAKTLEKDRTRRYPSADALADDLRRWRRHEPVLARPPSAVYRMAKFTRRHRTLCASLAIVFVVLASAAVVSTVLLVKIRHAGERLQTHLRSSNIERGRLLGRDGQVVVAEATIWDELLDLVAEGRSPAGPTAHGDPAFRQARWALWELYLEHPCLRTIADRHGAVTAMAWHSHERRLAWADDDGIATLDLDTPTAGRIDAPDARSVAALAFDAAGHLACGLDDGRVLLTDAGQTTWRRLGELSGSAITALAFSPDDASLAVGSRDGRVRLVEPRLVEPGTGAITQDFAEHDGPVNGVGFQAEGRLLVSGSERTVVERDLVTGRRTTFPAAGATAPDLQAAFAVHAGWVATASARHIELTRPERQVVMHTNADRVVGIAFVGGARLVTAGRDRTVRVIDLETGAERLLRGHAGALERLATTPAQDLAAAGGADLKVWDVAPAPGWTILPTTDRGPHSLAFDPGSRHLAVGGASGSIELWDPVAARRIRTLAEGTTQGLPICGIAFGPRGRILHSAGHDGAIRSFDLADPARREARRHPGAASCLALGPDGTTLACGGGEADPHVRLWDVTSHEPPRTLSGHTRRIPAVAFAPDGVQLASASIDRTVRLWDVRSGETMAVIGTGAPARAIVFSPDGGRLAYGTDDGAVVVIGSDGSGSAVTLDAGTSRVFALAFSRDGMLLASAVQEGVVKLWDGPSLRHLATISTGARPPLAVAFDEAGRRLAVGGDPGYLAVLDLEHFDRHIAGNAAAQLGRWRSSRSDVPVDAVEAWTRRTLERSFER